MSTATEIARIVREASRNKVLRSIMGKAEYQVKPMRGYLKVRYRNSNPLVGTKGITLSRPRRPVTTTPPATAWPP